MLQRSARNFRERGHVFQMLWRNSVAGDTLPGHTTAPQHISECFQQKHMVIKSLAGFSSVVAPSQPVRGSRAGHRTGIIAKKSGRHFVTTGRNGYP